MENKCLVYSIHPRTAYQQNKCRCATCKTAHKAAAHEYYLKNRDAVRRKRKLYREKHREEENRKRREYSKRKPDKIKEWHLKAGYGITLAQYNEMLLKQNGLCAICDTRTKLFVDHCHNTQTVRGLICSKCNFGIGNFDDTPALLERAIQYLARPTKAPKLG